MNILIPDQWLRKYLTTDATALQLKEYLSLCGPSIERIYGTGKDTVYDVEITGNRPDAMSVIGIAREAATILPRFGIKATLAGDPYEKKVAPKKFAKGLPFTVVTDPTLNPRWTSVIFDAVTVGPSPSWLVRFLELAGMRSLNNVVDITNFLMHTYGQPAHVFDYDTVSGHKMMLRESKKGENVTTLDGKTHTLPGGDIVIEDGSGNLIDLCGIMGGKSSSVTASTTKVMLFLQTYDPSHIRRTSMALAHRTAAAGLFEKGTDTDLVMPVLLKGMDMMEELTKGKQASPITDLYPHPYKPKTVSVKRAKVASYVGALSDREIGDILTNLGFTVSMTPTDIKVGVPSFRRDVAIDVDIIEEIARIWGYHTIAPRLPEREPPMAVPDPALAWEWEIKTRLRDWGLTETYTYSLLSERELETFDIPKDTAYRLANPLSSDWVYLRPTLIPSMLATVRDNLAHTRDLALFEMAMTYRWRKNDLPEETPHLVMALTSPTANAGEATALFFKAKGILETLVRDVLHISDVGQPNEGSLIWLDESYRLPFGQFGSVGLVAPEIRSAMGIRQEVALVRLRVSALIAHASRQTSFVPIPKYPPVVEDMTFVIDRGTRVSDLITVLRHADPHVADVSFVSLYGENVRTVRVTYQHPEKTLTNEAIVPIRKKLLVKAETIGATLKTT